MGRYVIVADSGSDISPEDAERHGIVIVPMHVTIDGKLIDDGDIPVGNMFERFRELGTMPKTSGPNPGDFATVFDGIHERDPEATVLYLAYSAATTSTFESARIAAEGRDFVVTVDTESASAGQMAIVMRTVRYLEGNPDATRGEVVAFVDDLKPRVHMGFIPGDLEYLRAGGRLSNAAFLGARLLKIKPVVELIGGKLVATMKLRGSMTKAALKMVDTFSRSATRPLDDCKVLLIRSAGLSEGVQRAVEDRLREKGLELVRWVDAHNVVSCHCGPGSFGMVLVQG